MEDDPQKIKNILDELNKKLTVPEWEEIDDYQALMSVSKNALGGVEFNASSGVIIKGFLNHRTGEIRTFYWKRTIKR